MKILMLLPGGVPADGGGRRIPALTALVERLSSRARLVVVLLSQPEAPRCYTYGEATVHNLTPGIVLRHGGARAAAVFPRLLLRLRRDEERFDVVHAFSLGWLSTLALLSGRTFGAPVVASLFGGEMVHLQEIDYGGWRGVRGPLHVRLALRFADRVTAGSEYALGPLRQRRSDALRLPLFPASPAARGGATTTRPVPPEGGPRLLTVSSVNRVKDPGTLLEALRRVLEERPDVRLDWVGEDTLGGWAAELAERLGVAHAVVFHGRREHEELPAFHRRATLYVQASRHESAGMAVCEAAQSGLPIVGTEVGLLAELAPDRAVAVAVGDPARLAEAILRLLRAPELARSIGERARRWGEAASVDQTVAQALELYGSLIAPAAPG